jgi:hypothetical protein
MNRLQRRFARLAVVTLMVGAPLVMVSEGAAAKDPIEDLRDAVEAAEEKRDNAKKDLAKAEAKLANATKTRKIEKWTNKVKEAEKRLARAEADVKKAKKALQKATGGAPKPKPASPPQATGSTSSSATTKPATPAESQPKPDANESNERGGARVIRGSRSEPGPAEEPTPEEPPDEADKPETTEPADKPPTKKKNAATPAPTPAVQADDPNEPADASEPASTVDPAELPEPVDPADSAEVTEALSGDAEPVPPEPIVVLVPATDERGADEALESTPPIGKPEQPDGPQQPEGWRPWLPNLDIHDGKDLMVFAGLFMLGFTGGFATKHAFGRRGSNFEPTDEAMAEDDAKQRETKPDAERPPTSSKAKEPKPLPTPAKPASLDRWFSGFRPYDSDAHVKVDGSPVARVRVEDPRPYRSHCKSPSHSLCGVTVRGPAHVKAKTRCQDAHRTFVLDSGTVIVAVADGVGSAERSDVGARFATHYAVDHLIEQLSTAGDRSVGDVMLGAVTATRDRLYSYAEQTETDLRSLACTLLIAVLRDGAAYMAHVGDGAIVARQAGKWVVASEPEQTTYVNYVTPLTSTNWRQACRIKAVSEVEALCLFSDGIERTCVSRDGQDYVVNEGFFGPIYEAATRASSVEDATRRVASTLDGPRLAAASDDDKTLVMVWSTTAG